MRQREEERERVGAQWNMVWMGCLSPPSCPVCCRSANSCLSRSAWRGRLQSKLHVLRWVGRGGVGWGGAGSCDVM